MDSETSTQKPAIAPAPTPETLAPPSPTKDRDFLNHLEAYLAKRDGVDKLLKISRYASKIVLASSALPESLILTQRLKSFESSVGLSRKAFRLGKFVQDLNALRNSHFHSKQEIFLAIIAYGGEGLYYFVEQFVWLAKAGLIDSKNSKNLGKISAWFEFIGYIGGISLKIRDLKKLIEDEVYLESTIEDFADGSMALADIRDGKGRLSAPLLVSFAGLLSALISAHKNWVFYWQKKIRKQ
ncbi:hypothetical protein GH714_015023 [Hevea brasiliensis]|uniref:Peroxisomal membrane protein 11A n=1 Tax=Hevea brasiliensis TaxID=3981 RepID=A0A6A6NH99_HEVBR|nr:hypothetical protein GH714_015023 [Hevea brasiliensis]